MTGRYAKMNPDKLREAVNELSYGKIMATKKPKK